MVSSKNRFILDCAELRIILNLYRVYKEALVNIVKNSQASQVSVTMHVSDETMALHIKDNGIGIKTQTTGGRGVPGTRKRADELGGDLSVTSEEGTEIHLVIPTRKTVVDGDV